jgi:SAM-dependent methyltransferase
MIEELVRNYYAESVQEEWTRLTRDAYHRLEFDTTLRFLGKHLPQKGRVLDAGGGPGRYTIELAKRGYGVVLLDLTPANLEFARQQIERAKVQNGVEQIVEGSIVDLARFADSTFDAVVCLGGPLSHVLEPSSRDRAIDELVRVCKKDAPIFVSVMGRLSVLVVELRLAPHEFEEPFFRSMRDTGRYPGHSGFTACHFFFARRARKRVSVPWCRCSGNGGIGGLGSTSRGQSERTGQSRETLEDLDGDALSDMHTSSSGWDE